MRLDRLPAVLLAFLILNPSSSPGATEATRAELAPPIPARDVGIDRSFGRMPSYFVENRGQIDGRVGYYLQGRTAAFFTGDGITYAFSKRPDSAHNRRHGTEGITLASMKPPAELPDPPAPPEPQRWAVAIDLVGARRPLWPEGDDLIPTIVSYFKGPQSHWKTALPTYQTVVYRDVWPGIDLDYTVKSGQMKYTFVVKPGAEPRAIKLRYRGAASIEVVDGELLVETPLGGIRDQKPLVYQDVDGCREEVSARHTLRKDGDDYVASFKLGRYDHARPLVIDPVVLAYCGYIGGGSDDGGYLLGGIAVDATGSAYVTSYAAGPDQTTFPTTVGPDLTYNPEDAFVAKVTADGTGLVYAGYIGGAAHSTRGDRIAVDATGNAYVTGWTFSDQTTFPVTVGPDLTHNGGGYDAFVAKVRADGTGLAYAGYIGGAGQDEGSRVAVDAGGNAYVTGVTTSSDTTFPVAIGPDLTFNGGAGDVDTFVAKVDADGTGLAYAGYIGGNGRDVGGGIAVDALANAYVTGGTASDQATFPVTGGPDLTYNGGDYDTFVAKVRADGTGLVYAGYIGGDAAESSPDVAVDAGGSAHVTGYTLSSEATFPVTIGPDLTYNGGENDAFVAKVKADGTGLVYAGYIGGSGFEYGIGIAVDACGTAYVSGWTSSDQTTFPVTVGPDLMFNGVVDAFVAKVSSSLCCLAVVAAVEDLRAVKQQASLDDIDLTWVADPAASGYNIWYVTRKVDIDLARQASQPPATGVADCSAPAPAPGNACTDFGAVSRGAPTVFFYQVRAACDATAEGP